MHCYKLINVAVDPKLCENATNYCYVSPNMLSLAFLSQEKIYFLYFYENYNSY